MEETSCSRETLAFGKVATTAAFQPAQRCLWMEGGPGSGTPPLMAVHQVPAQRAGGSQVESSLAEGTPAKAPGRLQRTLSCHLRTTLWRSNYLCICQILTEHQALSKDRTDISKVRYRQGKPLASEGGSVGGGEGDGVLCSGEERAQSSQGAGRRQDPWCLA